MFYTLPTFFRQTPRPMLRTYLDHVGVLADLSLDGPLRSSTAALVDALSGLDDATRARIDADFQDVHALADRHGTQLILDEMALRAPELDLPAIFEPMENHHERAMWLFLHRHHGGADLFDECLALAQLQDVTFARSRRLVGLPRSAPRTDAATLSGMADALRAAYRPQGRGQRCRIEYRMRAEPRRHAYFAWPEDYSTSELQYDGDDLARRSRRSVFHVVWVFDPEDGVLEISAPGPRQDAVALQEIFCRYALGMDGLPLGGAKRCWELNGLKRPDFPFPTEPTDRIARVELLGLRLHLAGQPKRRLSFEYDAGAVDSLHDWIRRVVNEQEVPLRMLDVNWAKLLVLWMPSGTARPRRATFTLSLPDTTSLGDSREHQVVRRYLKAWKIAS